MKKSVVGLGFGIYMCAPSATVQFRDVWFGTVGLVGERVVCVRGAYCRACEVVK